MSTQRSQKSQSQSPPALPSLQALESAPLPPTVQTAIVPELAEGGAVFRGLARWFQILTSVQLTTGMTPSRFVSGGTGERVARARCLVMHLLEKEVPRAAAVLFATALTSYSARSWAALDSFLPEGLSTQALQDLERIEANWTPLDDERLTRYRRDGWIPVLSRKFG